MNGKRVAIIGTGVSGLSAIKSCLEEGLEPVAFEKELDIGGVWHYTPEDNGRRVCVFDSVYTNSNRVAACFSDFPFTDDTPLYLDHRRLKEYLKQYADKFQLLDHIKFNSEVISVENDDTQQRRWKVKWRSDGADTQSNSFDGVMVCSGLFSKPYIPNIPGLDQFQGVMTHSGHYRTHEPFKYKRVAVIGFGNSGCDIACKLGQTSSKVYLTTGQGAWLIPRVWAFNRPIEWVFGNRFINSLGPIASTYLRIVEFFSHMCFDPAALGIVSQCPSNEKLPVARDDLIQNVAFGIVKLTPAVVKVDESAVHFKDGSRQEVDAIVLGTGYEPYFPFFSCELLPWKGEGLSGLYKQMFPTSPKHEGLCYIGLINSASPFIAMSELQTRIGAAVFSGRIKLPEEKIMETWVRDANANVDRSNLRGPFPYLNWVQYEEELATFLGVQPRPWRTLFTDFELGKALLFNPPSASAFRLTGHHQWAGAREVVINSEKTLRRAMSPIHGNSCLEVLLKKMITFFGCFLMLAVIILLCGMLMERQLLQ